MNLQWRPTIGGASSVAIDIMFLRGIFFSLKKSLTILKIDPPLITTIMVHAKSISWIIFPDFTIRTYANSKASLFSKVDLSIWRENSVDTKSWTNKISTSSVISWICHRTVSLRNGIFVITLCKAEWCKTVLKFLWQGSINSSPMVWAFLDIAISFDILYEAIKPSSHFFDEPANKPETNCAFRNLSLIIVKNDKSLLCLSGWFFFKYSCKRDG